MTPQEIQTLVRQEMANVLASQKQGISQEDVSNAVSIEAGFRIAQLEDRIMELEQRLAGAEDDHARDSSHPQSDVLAAQHLPPLLPMLQGGLDVIFRELKIRSKNESGTWVTRSVGGGAATALAASQTSYCWLKVSYTRRTLGNIRQWGISAMEVEVTTSAGSPASGESNTVDSSSTNQTAILFATVTTDANKVTEVAYHPFLLHQNPECALAITPLTSGDMESMTVVVDTRVDTSAKTIDIKTCSVEVYNKGTESAWTTIHTGGGCGSGS